MIYNMGIMHDILKHAGSLVVPWLYCHYCEHYMPALHRNLLFIHHVMHKLMIPGHTLARYYVCIHSPNALISIKIVFEPTHVNHFKTL